MLCAVCCALTRGSFYAVLFLHFQHQEGCKILKLAIVFSRLVINSYPSCKLFCLLYWHPERTNTSLGQNNQEPTTGEIGALIHACVESARNWEDHEPQDLKVWMGPGRGHNENERSKCQLLGLPGSGYCSPMNSILCAHLCMFNLL